MYVVSKLRWIYNTGTTFSIAKIGLITKVPVIILTKKVLVKKLDFGKSIRCQQQKFWLKLNCLSSIWDHKIIMKKSEMNKYNKVW